MGTRDSESLHCYTFFRLFHIIKKDEKFNFKNNSNFLVHFNFSTFFFHTKIWDCCDDNSWTNFDATQVESTHDILTLSTSITDQSSSKSRFFNFLFSLFSARDLFSADLHLTIFQRRLTTREKFTPHWDGKSSNFSLLHTLFLLHNLSVDLLWVEIAEWVREN